MTKIKFWHKKVFFQTKAIFTVVQYKCCFGLRGAAVDEVVE
jgi:hypothetical protein